MDVLAHCGIPDKSGSEFRHFGRGNGDQEVQDGPKTPVINGVMGPLQVEIYLITPGKPIDFLPFVEILTFNYIYNW